ncbi:MAG: hypothetical protein JKY50_13430 [Oleispira sp.]|nr:hypothetical protein [Oleispira sp.]MBL4880411.1 hypothetical protein [Oleispira sp.]
MFRIGLILVITSLISACTASDPNSDLIAVAQKKVDVSKSPSTGVGRDPSDIQLSDRQYTYVDLDPAQLGNNGPWFLDLDIEFDSANIWLQSDIDCEGCDPELKQEREQQWDLKIDGRDISLNTNRVDEDNGATYQAVASTDIFQPLQSFNDAIAIDSLSFKPQSASIEPQLQGEQLVKGAASFGASFLIRTTVGDRYIYFQLVDANEIGHWVLFHIREQVIGIDESFKPARKLYLRWGEDAIGNQGIMHADKHGILRAYFNFDACYDDPNSASCFSGDSNANLGSNVVSANKINNYDLYFQVRIGTWDQAAMILNGGGARDTEFNDEFDAAGLYLGKNGLGKLAFDNSLEELWEFNSMEEFRRVAVDKNFEMKNFGSDGFTSFDKNIWYDVVRDQAGISKAQANQRIYLFETTKKEGLALQISKTDNDGNIRQVAYQGPTVKQRRQFDIRFRQPQTVNIDIRLDNSDLTILDSDELIKNIPIIALSREIVDSETGLALSKDEYKLIKFNIQPINFITGSAISDSMNSLKPHIVNSQLSAFMSRNSNDDFFSTEAREEAYSDVLLTGIPPIFRSSCQILDQQPAENGQGHLAIQVKARLPGKELISWRLNYRVCQNDNN